MRRLLRHGLLSGLVAGLAMAAFLLVVVRGPLNDALAYEDTLAHDAGTHAHGQLFSTGMQEVGGSIGLILFGIFLGVIYAVVLASLAPRFGPVSAMQLALRMGMIGFVVVVVVPFLKYPANPPAVGDPESVGTRTVLYLSVLAFSILLAYGVALAVGSQRFSELGRAWLTAGLYGAGLVAIFVLMPAAEPIVGPADLVWNFRIASLGGLTVVWLTLSLMMGSYLTLDARAASLAAGEVGSDAEIQLDTTL